MEKITRPGPELRAQMEKHHPELTALIDAMYAEFGARLVSFKSSTGNIEVVSKRVAATQDRVAVRIWPATTPAEAREIENQNRNQSGSMTSD